MKFDLRLISLPPLHIDLPKIVIEHHPPQAEANEREEHRQRAAWRIVRASADTFSSNSGAKKRDWCVKRMRQSFPELLDDQAEEYVRAAYVHFRIEAGPSS